MKKLAKKEAQDAFDRMPKEVVRKVSFVTAQEKPLFSSSHLRSLSDRNYCPSPPLYPPRARWG